MTEWRKIPGFSRYSINEHGDVRRDVRMRARLPGPIKATPNDRGYLAVSLTNDEARLRKVTVHTIVALAFLGERPEGLYVCHTDGNRLNNHRSNLRYDTPAGNTRDSERHMAFAYGTRHPRARLTESDIPQIRDLWNSGLFTQKEIGVFYGVCQRSIWHVVHDLKWRHVNRLRGLAVGVAA